MRPGTRVEIVSSWSAFKGHRGRVTRSQPDGSKMVVLDADVREWPLRFGPAEVVQVTDDLAMTND